MVIYHILTFPVYSSFLRQLLQLDKFRENTDENLSTDDEYKDKITFVDLNSLKLVSAIFCEIFIFSRNDSPSKTMKNIF